MSSLRAEADRALVRLVHAREESLQPRSVARAEEQQARRHRIERSAVPDAREAERASDPLDDVVRRQTRGLVHEQQETAAQRFGQGSRRDAAGHFSSSSSGEASARTFARSSSMRAPRSSVRSWKK
jgi:hypothetical protein